MRAGGALHHHFDPADDAITSCTTPQIALQIAAGGPWTSAEHAWGWGYRSRAHWLAQYRQWGGGDAGGSGVGGGGG